MSFLVLLQSLISVFSRFNSASSKSAGHTDGKQQACRQHGGRFHGGRLHGAALSEFAVTLPVLLLLGLAGLQAGLMYHAKNIVTYATFEAARTGAVSHAGVGPMKQELGLRIAPLFGGDGSAEKAFAAITRGTLEALDPRYTTIEILNPTQQAFDDFAVTTYPATAGPAGITEIPNDSLRYRSRDTGATSGVSLQDANLLKIKTTYAYRLTVPLLDRVIPAVMTWLDPDNLRYYALGRIPLTAVATLRMQSPARLAGSGLATPPDDAGEGSDQQAATDGQGGADNTSQPPSQTDPVTAGDSGEVTDHGNASGLLTSPQACDPGRTSCNPPQHDRLACAADAGQCTDTRNGGPADCASQSAGTTTSSPQPVVNTEAGNPINMVTGHYCPGKLSNKFSWLATPKSSLMDSASLSN